ncbi:hypothetical protein ACH47C_38095 [Streptomyces rishiriensis]|uniref:hypothetical protein n=1 Tax=Streptomyces rishiriensis TaxID=68264 RepID=UPI00131F03F7
MATAHFRHSSTDPSPQQAARTTKRSRTAQDRIRPGARQTSRQRPPVCETDIFDICWLNGERVSGETVPGARFSRFHDLVAAWREPAE